MTLQLITNWMVKDFYIWWKYCRAKKTILPMVHHFLKVHLSCHVCSFLQHIFNIQRGADVTLFETKTKSQRKSTKKELQH